SKYGPVLPWPGRDGEIVLITHTLKSSPVGKSKVRSLWRRINGAASCWSRIQRNYSGRPNAGTNAVIGTIPWASRRQPLAIGQKATLSRAVRLAGQQRL